MCITKTKFSFQNRFSVYFCNVKCALIASKQLRNVPKHLPSHKISFSNLFLSFLMIFCTKYTWNPSKLPILNRKSWLRGENGTRFQKSTSDFQKSKSDLQSRDQALQTGQICTLNSFWAPRTSDLTKNKKFANILFSRDIHRNSSFKPFRNSYYHRFPLTLDN